MVIALTGCQMDTGEFGAAGGSSGGFGGSGGSGQACLSLARDVCARAVESRGGMVLRIKSGREIRGGAEVVMQTRRDAMTVSTQRQRSTFDDGTGGHRIRTI